MAEHHGGYPLQPRKKAGPSYRPMPRAGEACPARQGVSGSGEGPPTFPSCPSRRLCRRQSGRPIKAQGSGMQGLCRPSRAETPSAMTASTRKAGCSPACPVRRPARPLGALTMEEPVHIKHRCALQPGVPSPSQRMRHHGSGVALARLFLPLGQRRLGLGMMAQAQGGSFGKGPLEGGVANLCP